MRKKKKDIIHNSQVTLDEFLIEKFKEKMNKILLISNKNNHPIVLYRRTIEENEVSIEEEIASVSEKYVIIQIFTHGGYLPVLFREQHIFTPDEFIYWILKRSRSMLLQCLENIDEFLNTCEVV
ncbi:MAG TPA: hypothetical protein VFT83_06030 [Nitrososphaeraceae archaeon]|nr:hypothetical protein [Nitrososphaeraceae archaeon]HEU5173072.1 hypothetical protein [Nitrososphaeraceae archaeon]